MDLVHVGFTGTQEGMTSAQMSGVLYFLGQYEAFIGYHGLCVGADMQFDTIARTLPGFRGMVGFPAKGVGDKAITPDPSQFFEICDPLPPLSRNRLIAAKDVLLATPKEDRMVVRSGTWTTVRYAIAKKTPVFIVLPSGLIVPW